MSFPTLRTALMGAASAALFVAAPLSLTAYAEEKNAKMEMPAAKMDADMKAVMDAHKALGGKPIEDLEPAEARQQPTPTDAVMAVLKKNGYSTEPLKLGKVEDIEIDGADGRIPARIYTPEGDGPFPVIVYFHGGGWVIADIDVYDAAPRALAKGAKAIVVAPSYRQAPEHKFPAAHDDAFAAYRWVLKNVADHGGDASRVAVAGESAGGNLAANVAIMARDKDVTEPLHQLLVYPAAQNDMTTESYKENEAAWPLNKPMMEWFVKHVFESKDQTSDPRLSLVKAKLNDLPPATIILAEIDPLRTDGEMLAKAMKDAGVEVTLETYDGAAHEFFGMAAVVEDAKDAQALASKALAAAFAKPPKKQAEK
jgi:acetyl esterase